LAQSIVSATGHKTRLMTLSRRLGSQDINLGTIETVWEICGSIRARISLEDFDFAARYGDRPWCKGEKNIRCEKLDWCAIQTAMDDLSGHMKRQNKLKAMRRKAGERKEKHRDKLKFSSLLVELQAADFICLARGDISGSRILEGFGPQAKG
jgi:hypothetical protein